MFRFHHFHLNHKRPLTRAALAAFLAAAVLSMAPLSAEAAHSLPESSFTQVQGTDLYLSPSVSQAEQAFETSLFLSLPENIRQRMMGDGVKVYLISAADDTITSATLKNSSSTGRKVSFVGLTTHPVYVTVSDIAGHSTVGRARDCTIEIQTDMTRKNVDRTRLIHEVGHFVDSAAGSGTGEDFAISSSDAWQTLFAKYESSLLAGSAYQAVPDLYSASEGWADAFRLLWTDPAALQAISDDLFQFVYQESVSLPVSGGDIDLTAAD